MKLLDKLERAAKTVEAKANYAYTQDQDYDSHRESMEVSVVIWEAIEKIKELSR